MMDFKAVQLKVSGSARLFAQRRHFQAAQILPLLFGKDAFRKLGDAVPDVKAVDIPPARRLYRHKNVIGDYIGNILWVRRLHGDDRVIDLAMGNPDIIPSQNTKRALRYYVDDPWAHRYADPRGLWQLQKAIADWHEKRFGVKIDPNENVVIVQGAAGGVATILSAFANQGDGIILPRPGYAMYWDMADRYELKENFLPLDENNRYQPLFNQVSPDAARQSKFMILNYPHNPTGFFATKETLEAAVRYAGEHQLMMIYDMDNSEIHQDPDKKPMSLFEIPGAEQVGVQVHTFSKAHNMPGWRIGFVIGKKEWIDHLKADLMQQNQNVPTMIQQAAIEALADEPYIEKVNGIYRQRKNYMVEELRKLGAKIEPSEGTYYLTTQVPDGFTSEEFFKYVLHKTGVAFTPDYVFHHQGKPMVRIVMSANMKRLEQAVRQLQEGGIRFDLPRDQWPKEALEELDKIMREEVEATPRIVKLMNAYKRHMVLKWLEMETKLAGKDSHLRNLAPSLKSIASLPDFIYRDNQEVWLRDGETGDGVVGEIREIPPFSKPEAYEEIRNAIRDTWLPAAKDRQGVELLQDYLNQKFWPDAAYETLWYDGKLQGVVNLEAQKDGRLWIRSLNTAPWNQGANRKLKGVGTALVYRALSYAIEADCFPLTAATRNPAARRILEYVGMKPAGTVTFKDGEYQRFEIDRETALEFLEKGGSVNARY